MKHNWYPSQPNGLLLQQCVMNYRTHLGWKWNDQGCKLEFCSTCLMPLVQVYHLRGPKKFGQVDSLSWNMQSNGSLITFGDSKSGQSSIYWYPMARKTELVNHENNWTKVFHQDLHGLLGTGKSQWLLTSVSTVKRSCI